MKGVVIGSVIAFVCIVMGGYGVARFRQLYFSCLDDYAKNDNLLNEQVCRNIRMQYDLGLDKKCAEARAANQISVYECAVSRMWTGGEIVRLWSMATDSEWKVYGMILFAIGLVIHSVFTSINHAVTVGALSKSHQYHREPLLLTSAPPIQSFNLKHKVPSRGIAIHSDDEDDE